MKSTPHQVTLACCIVLWLSRPCWAQQPTPLVILRDDQYGFSDFKGKVIIKPTFDNAMKFSEGLAPFAKGNQWGFVDEKGNVTIKPQFAGVEPFHESLAVVTVIDNFGNKKLGYIDRNGNQKIRAQFDSAKSFSDGLAVVREDNRWFYINQTGQTVIEADRNLEAAGSFTEGLAPVLVSGRWGYIDKTGKIMIQASFGEAGPFSENLASVRVGPAPEGKMGFINREGKFVIDPKFAWAKEFSGGLAPVQFERDGPWGYIDREENRMIPTSFKDASAFENGVAEVVDDAFGYQIYIDRHGRPLFKKSDRPIQGLAGANRIDVVLDSSPEGVKVYLIPLFDWQNDPNILKKNDVLEFLYKVPEGNTKVRTKVFQQTYVAVFVCPTKKLPLQWIPLPGQTNTLKADCK